MNLGQLRRRFIEISGRYDLIVDQESFANPEDRLGADFFINNGIRYLDLTQKNPAAPASYSYTLSVGDYEKHIPHLRSPKHIYVRTSSEESEVELKKVHLKAIRESFPEPVSQISKSKPAWYAITTTRIMEPLSQQGLSGYTIMTMPPADVEYTVEVIGDFFSVPLSEDEDVNWWTENLPDAAVYAAMYELEISYRNMEGAEGWKRAIRDMLRQIDYDQVEASFRDASSMTNSLPEVRKK